MYSFFKTNFVLTLEYTSLWLMSALKVQLLLTAYLFSTRSALIQFHFLGYKVFWGRSLEPLNQSPWVSPPSRVCLPLPLTLSLTPFGLMFTEQSFLLFSYSAHVLAFFKNIFLYLSSLDLFCPPFHSLKSSQKTLFKKVRSDGQIDCLYLPDAV